MNKSNPTQSPSNKVTTNKMTQLAVTPKNGNKSDNLIADNFFQTPSVEDFFQNLPPDLEGWAGLYVKLQVEGIKAPETVRAVQNDLTKFRIFFLDHHNGNDLRKWLPRTTQRFMDHLQEIGQRPKTVHRALITVRSFGKWMISVRPDIFPLGDPTKGTRPPAQESMRPKGLTERQVKQVLDASYHLICQTYPDEKIAGVESSKEEWFRKAHRQMRRPFRDYAIIMLLLNGGLRRAEICDLTLDHLKGRHLRDIKCKGNLFRDVLLGEETLRTLQGYLNEERPRDEKMFDGSNALFLPSSSRKHRNRTGKLAPRTINAIVKNIAAEANKGFPQEDHIQLHPHMFRHTHAYQILKKGRSLTYLQKRLGHLSMNYLALYTQMPEGEERELLDEAEFK